MDWSTILLPPHFLSIEVPQLPLDNIITDDTEIFTSVHSTLNEMRAQNNSLTSQANPYHYFICSLGKVNIMIIRMTVTTFRILYDISRINLDFLLWFLSDDYKMPIAELDHVRGGI